jgi:hypothetical protein
VRGRLHVSPAEETIAIGQTVSSSQLQKLRVLLGCALAADEWGMESSEYERLALPYVFRPQMSAVEALVGVATAFTRIFWGSLLFAVWGAYTLIAWRSIRNHFWRTAAMLSLVVLFVFLFGLLMLGISALARKLLPKKRLIVTREESGRT